jgi:hypothetical protein
MVVFSEIDAAKRRESKLMIGTMLTEKNGRETRKHTA